MKLWISFVSGLLALLFTSCAFASVGCTCCCAGSTCHTSGCSAVGATDSYAEGEALVLIKFTPTESGAKMTDSDISRCAAAVAEKIGAKVLGTYNALSVSSGKIFAHLRSDKMTADELIAALKKDPNVISASKNSVRHMNGTF